MRKKDEVYLIKYKKICIKIWNQYIKNVYCRKDLDY